MKCVDSGIQGARPRRSRLGAWATVLTLAVFASGCDQLLEVQTPDIVQPEDLASPAGLATLAAGALGDLAVAMDGSASGHGATPGLVHYSGTMSDEYVYSGTFPTRRDVDQRQVKDNNGSTGGVFTNLHRARAAAGVAAGKIQEFSNPSQDPLFAEMKNLEGLTYIMFGEHFCSGVPFSDAPESGDIVFGTPLTTAEMFQASVTRFDAALASPGGSQDMTNLASVLKARALLNLGQPAPAAALVSGVPTDFMYAFEHSENSPGQTNGIYTLSFIRRQYAIADNKGGNGLPYRSANDPRTPWDLNSSQGEDVKGQDDQTPYFNQLVYTTGSSPVPMATGIEARLIEAEAMLASAGPGGQFDAIHNTLRATMGLPPINTAGMTQSQAEDVHFSERAFWLYSTAHRVGDMRRLVRDYGRSSESVWPSGSYFKGGSYGPDTNLPIPLEEANNPNFTGCIDRNP